MNSFDTAKKYCNSLTAYSRLATREVQIGGLPMGNFHPIRIQSMTTTDTMDTIATVEQTIRMVQAGCDYVRITAPSLKEAQNLEEIKKELKKRGYTVPLVADIHFTPNAAELAARIVEKVRVNPGNYVDKKKFQTLEYTDAEYHEEIERIYQRFSPLVKICKEYGTAMRIGTNHGSLSDRIMSRYGDNPAGMVESALEFVRICRDHDYHNLVLSMKSSNPKVMVQAYRLLINRMAAEGMNYPLHLGVTEAGDGEDGRVKSAMGIGTLLEDGIGDTVRVSLTEEPEFEAPVAIALVNRYTDREKHAAIPPVDSYPVDPFDYTKRNSFELIGIGGANVPRVFADLSANPPVEPNDLNKIGYFYQPETDKWNMSDQAADFLFLGSHSLPFDAPHGLRIVAHFEQWKNSGCPVQSYPFYTVAEYLAEQDHASAFNFIEITLDDILQPAVREAIRNDKTCILVVKTDNQHAMAELRRFFVELLLLAIDNPVILKHIVASESAEQFALSAATDFGALLIDGFGDGVWALSDPPIKTETVNRITFGILQAARVRISKTEYIACPSCGRTLFDLVETTDKIRKRTEHLKGVKIAIMGCIVNGPGEMADADYGYVGSGPGKITLYKGKEIIKRAVQSEDAVDELISIIKNDGLWTEPKVL